MTNTLPPTNRAKAADADAEARERLRHSLDESLWVEAAAGTGKTTVLIERLVAILASGRTSIDRIVAVTFTRKAAGELKLRLRQELDRAHDAAEGDVRTRLASAIGHLEEAHIGTIHSFCAELLRRRPVEAGIDPLFVEMDDAQAAQLYQRAFRAWIERRLEEMPPGLTRALKRLALRPGFDGASPIDRLRLAGRDLVDWRDFTTPWRREPFDRRASLDRLVDRLVELDRLARLGAPNDPLRRELEPVSVLADYLRRTEQDAGHRDHDELEAQLLDLARQARFRPGSRRQAKRGPTALYAPDLPRQEVQEAFEEFLEALDDFERLADADLAELLREELSEVLEGYEQLKRGSGRLDFLDLLLRSRELLIDWPKARRELQGAFSHLFVDEFQDTDPLQAEILLLLSADDAEVDDWRQISPRPGSLLLVGDPKQSIYRFRRADVVLYQEMKEQLSQAGVGVVVLSRSFRAHRPLQQAINAAFQRSMREDRRSGQPAYVPLDGDRPASEDQPYLVALPVPHPFGDRGWPTKAAIEASLPTAAAAWITWLLRSSGWTVRDPDHPDRRVPIAPRHICVLFRRYLSWGRDVTAPYLRALESRGVPHLLVGGRTLHQREEVETLRAALAAIEWPDDALSVYATLRGALFGFTDDVLLRFKAEAGHFDPFRRRPELDGELEEVAAALDTLADMHRQRNDVPIAETLNRLLEHARAHAAFALRPAGHQVLANVQRVTDMARSFERRGGLSFRGFVEQLDEAAERPGSAGSPLLEQGAEGVRVMTVHSAKGLEFPVVVLADPTCNLATREPSMHLDAARRLCARRLLGCTPWELIEHAELEKDRDRAESVRLAYVAATRARDLLVVPGLGTRPWKGGWTEPLDGAIYPAAGRAQNAAPAPGCPGFGVSTTLHDPRAFDPRQGAPIRPGEHRPRAGDHRVVWWDPSRLDLRTTGNFGVRHSKLLAPDEDGEAVQQGLDDYLDWKGDREEAIEQGSRPSREVVAVTDFEQWPTDPPDVGVEITVREAERPSGRRFGSLVHAVLSEVDLETEESEVGIADFARLHGRLHSCPEEEIEAAAEATTVALSHPLLERARQADRVCRETPFLLRLERTGGERELLIEGVIDLAFREDGEWTVVDFKTDAEFDERQEAYRRQVAWYVEAIRRLTGEPASGVLLGV